MEFSAVQQFRSTEPFPLLEQRSNDANSLMYSCGVLPPQAHTTHSHGVSPMQNLTGWSLGNLNHLHHHNAVFFEAQKARAGAPTTRTTTMLAAHGFRDVGVQNPQGEYLPQPKMPPRVASVQQPALVQPTADQNNWTKSNTCGDLEYSGLGADLIDYSHGILGADDDNTIIDLRQYSNFGQDLTQDLFSDPSRRMSESTYSMSSNGPLVDVPSFEDIVSSNNQGQQDTDWAALLNTSMNPQLESSISPRSHQRESAIRNGSRARASPVANMRSSPYTLESTRNKRWSTGMYPGQVGPSPYQFSRYSSYYGSSVNPQTGFHNTTDAMAALQSQNYLFPGGSQFSNAGMLFSSADQFQDATSRPLASQGFFRMLQSNADRLAGCASHFADLSDPPDLFSSLHEEPCDPPEEDMNPSDPDMIPREQELRFQGDLYTPKWVRGVGNKREGWCGLCKPGRWLVLKNSAFWYDKSFTHGVSAATGAAFQGPQETRRTDGNLDVWEGLCGSCGDWVALVSSKKKGTTWFRHAYKCHTHPKVKDGPKRRREVAVGVSRSCEPCSATDDTVTTAESPSKEPRIVEIEEDQEVKPETMKQDISSDGDATPISTPQLTHTQLSTPQISTMQTPGSQHQPQVNDRKRFSVGFDSSGFSQSFTTQLETFSEDVSESIDSNILPSTEASEKTIPFMTTIGMDVPSFTMDHDGTFTTQAESFSLSNLDANQLFPDAFMAHDSTNDFFPASHMIDTHQHFEYDTSVSASQVQQDFSNFASTTDTGLDGALSISL